MLFALKVRLVDRVQAKDKQSMVHGPDDGVVSLFVLLQNHDSQSEILLFFSKQKQGCRFAGQSSWNSLYPPHRNK